MAQCPRHPSQPAEDCSSCEREAEDRAAADIPDDDFSWREGQDRYERWLDAPWGD